MRTSSAHIVLGLLAAIISLAAVACSDDDASEQALVPGEQWVTAAAADVGLDPAKVDALVTRAAKAKSDCLALVRHGRLVVDQYWNGKTADDDQEIYSATKSVTSALVGIAQDRGSLSIEEPASTYLTEWRGSESEDVTVRQILTQTSGRYQDYETDYVKLLQAEDLSAFAIALQQQYAPDTVWVYNGAAVQTLEEVLERATGEDVGDYAEANLFGPLGMDVHFLRDASGDPPTFGGLQAGCLDMARFGLMALRGGKWGDERIVSADYMSAATSTATDLNGAYGYLWWVNTDEPWIDPLLPESSGRYMPDAPIDAYGALGTYNQMVLVLPTQDMVVVRLAAQGAEWEVGPGLINEFARLAVDAVLD